MRPKWDITMLYMGLLEFSRFQLCILADCCAMVTCIIYTVCGVCVAHVRECEYAKLKVFVFVLHIFDYFYI